MKFLLHFEFKGGAEDEIVLEATTIEEIRELANKELDKRQPIEDAWGEEILP